MKIYSDEIVKRINFEAKTVKGKIVLSCSKAFKIAEQTNISPADVGKICDECNIRIISCQLGCFKP